MSFSYRTYEKNGFKPSETMCFEMKKYGANLVAEKKFFAWSLNGV
jgi:hypothetical protein